MLAEHSIEPVVAKVFRLEEAAAAMGAIADRGRIGKIVIEMGDST
jgi:NADPH:quinone reductase-like Zn-dependent oxidoreductase